MEKHKFARKMHINDYTVPRAKKEKYTLERRNLKSGINVLESLHERKQIKKTLIYKKKGLSMFTQPSKQRKEKYKLGRRN